MTNHWHSFTNSTCLLQSAPFRLFLVLFLLLIQPCTSLEQASCEKILEMIHKELPLTGVLKNDSGFIYVDVDDAYIHKVAPLIEGFEEPPYFGSSHLVGAHITVIYPYEMEEYGIRQINEAGQVIAFQPKGCKIVSPPRWKEIDKVYLVVVEAPALDIIRKKYGLPKRQLDFHITLAVKRKPPKAA